MVFRKVKLNVKKVLRNILVIVLAVLMCNLVLTKIVYDSCFGRQDSVKAESIPSELSQMISSRRQLGFLSGKNTLSAYYYQGKNNRALVVLAPGYTAGADDYLWQINSLLSDGYGVFAFDSTGSFNSGGSSSVGFSQELCDLGAALEYIEENAKFGYKSLVLFGHSRGGYAVACASRFGYDADAVISVSGVNSAMEGIMDSSVRRIGTIAYANYPALWFYQATIFGMDIVNVCADEEISSNDTPTLIIHGKNDTKLPYDEFSIISHREEITNKNARYLLWDGDGNDGHTSILFDKNGKANAELMEEINDFIKQSIT